MFDLYNELFNYDLYCNFLRSYCHLWFLCFTGEMSMVELLEKYKGAYASDFEEPSASASPDSSEESEGTEEEAEEETEGEDSADDSSSSGELKFMMIVVLSKVPTSVPFSTRVKTSVKRSIETYNKQRVLSVFNIFWTFSIQEQWVIFLHLYCCFLLWHHRQQEIY